MIGHFECPDQNELAKMINCKSNAPVLAALSDWKVERNECPYDCHGQTARPPVRGGAISHITGVAPILARHHRLTILGRTDPALPTEYGKEYHLRETESEGSFKNTNRRLPPF